jgi:hypothetical protein
MTRQHIQDALSLKHRDHFEKAYLKPALTARFDEVTLLEAPRSNKQDYHLTDKGRRWRNHADSEKA